MFRVVPLSLADLARPRVLSILLKSLLVTLLIFIALGVIAMWALDGADPCGWWSVEGCELGLAASGLGAVLLTVLGLWLLFPAVALGVIAAFSDKIVAAIEEAHYPAASAAARPITIAGGLVLGLRSAARLLAYNLVALPFYLLLLFTGIGSIILFILVNGVAIGRDLGEMVAARHGDAASRRDWLHDTRGERAAIGIIVTALFMVPAVNLVAPVLGAAMATHLYHDRRRPTLS